MEKIGLIGLSLDLYKNKLPKFIEKLSTFQNQLKEILENYSEVISFGPIVEKTQIDEISENFKEQDILGVIIVFLSYSPSLLISPFLKKINKPILIWNTQKLFKITKNFGIDQLLENHGIHGVQDLACVLKRENVSFQLITGHYKDKNTYKQIKNWIDGIEIVKKFKKSRIGNLGGFFPQMGDFYIEREVLKSNLGIEIVDISFDKVANFIKTIKRTDIDRTIKQDLKKFKPKNLSRETHERSVKLELALRKVIKMEKLNGISINFLAFDKFCGLETVPFLAICKFLSEGMGYAGEGDVLTASSVLLLQYLTGEANFVEMFTADFSNNLILMCHMAESNPKMAKKDEPIYMVEFPLIFNECKPATILSFTLKEGIATLLNFTQTKENKIKFIVSNVEVIDRKPLKNIISPHFFIRPSKKVKEFLTDFSLQGGTHHSALCYGDQREKLKLISEIINLPYFEI